MLAETELDRWFYKGPDGKHGPISKQELLHLLVDRAIPAESLVWRNGIEAWSPAAELVELRVAEFPFPSACSGNRVRRPNRLILPCVGIVAAMGVVVAMMAKPTRPVATPPSSLRERLIVIGRSADLESMPVVIDAIADPDVAAASTAVIVAEGLLGVRYSDADRKNPIALAGKITADWKMTQEQMRRRLAGKELKAP